MEHFDTLLGRYFAGEADAKEIAEVDAWKSQNLAEFNLLKEAWNQPVQINQTNFDKTAAWNKIAPSVTEKPKGKVITFKRALVFSAAASILLLVGLFAGGFFGSQMIETINNGSSPLLVNLPDGSNVTLAPGSELAYAEDFSDNRSLNLKGEAYFDVAKDAKHPFIISAGIGEIEVLGTAFNVVTTELETKVSVSHGLVALRNEKTEIKLAEGQSAIADKNNISAIISVDANDVTWFNGEFTFVDAPLNEIISDLNKYYKDEIVLSNSESGDILLTAQFKNQSLEEVIEIICLTSGLKSTKQPNKVILE